MRLPRQLVIAGLCLTPAALIAQTPAITPSTTVPAVRAPEEIIDSLRLRDAPLDLVIDRLEVWTGRIVLRPQALPAAAITLNIPKPVPKSEAIQALVSALALNNIGVVEMGEKYLKIIELANKTRTEAPELITGSLLGLPPSGKVASKVFELNNVKASEFVPQLNTLLNVQLGGAVLFNNTNSFLVTDSIANLQRVEQLLLSLDRPASTDFTPKFYSLHFAKASDLVNRVKQMLQSPNQQALGNSLSLSADDRTNQVVLIADAKQLPFFDELIGKLDTKSDPNTRTDVIKLNNADAVALTTKLTQLVTNQSTAANKGGAGGTNTKRTTPIPTPADAASKPPVTVMDSGVAGVGTASEFSTLLTLVADDRTNAIIVSGTIDDIRLAKELITKLDQPLPMVRIEVLIAEVTLNNANETGINALGFRVENSRLTGVSGSSAGGSLGAVGGTATTPGFANLLHGDALSGVISLSPNSQKSNVRILATPTLSVSHNKEATFLVGESRPTFNQVQSSDSTNASSGASALTSSVTYKDAGTELKLKPLIGPDGTVQLEITQKFNAFGTTSIDLGSGLQQAPINKRETSSYLNVTDGEIIVLSGYISETKSKSRARLGPIPIIGDLFGARNSSIVRTEQIVLLRPHVMMTPDKASADAMKEAAKLNNPALNAAINPPAAPAVPPESPTKESGPKHRR